MKDDSEEDMSDEDIMMKCRRVNPRKSSSPVPTDPTLLAEFCKTNLTKILNQTQLTLDEMSREIKVNKAT